MIFYIYKYLTLLIFFLLVQSTFFFMTSSWGMAIEEEKKLPSIQSQSTFCLRDGLEAFENEQFEKAAEIFTQLHAFGAMVPVKYLEHMKVKLPEPFAPIPEAGLKLSEEFLKASLAYIEYKKHNNKKNLQKIATYILNGNTHALSLMKTLYNKDTKILNTIKTVKNFKKCTSINDIQKSFKPYHTNSICFWNCLDQDTLCTFYESIRTDQWKKAARRFDIECQKGNHMGQIALDLMSQYPEQKLFWAHVALENGRLAACDTLADTFTTYYLERPENELLSFSRYYVSKLFENELENELFGIHGDIYYREGKAIKARLYYHRAIRLVTQAEYNYGLMLHEGDGGEQNTKEGLRHIEEAAKRGLLSAQLSIATAYHEGENTEQDDEKARYYFKLAAYNEFLTAEFNYGTRRTCGNGGEQYIQASSTAAFNYGNMCLDGKGGEKDIQEAYRFIKRAADLNLVHAQSLYASMCNEGIGAEPDYIEARKYLKMSADNGDVAGMHDYASFCVSGKGGPIENEEAFRYFEKAEAKGMTSTDSLFWCGYLCFSGFGPNKNLIKARDYYKRSAEKGYSRTQRYSAMAHYACMCFKGEGGPKDLAEAKKYWQIAAKGGDARAMYILYRLSYEGSPQSSPIETHQGCVETKEVERSSEEKNTNVVIPFPFLPSEEDDSDEEKNLAVPVAQPDDVDKATEQDIKEELAQELNHCAQVNTKEIMELREKKQAQKEAATRTQHTLTARRQDINPDSFTIEILPPSREKSEVDYKTLSFVKTLFGQGDVKINTFSNTAAKQAFADLGCSVVSKEGENSTQVSFITENNRVITLKYHNPHGHGDDNLYDALKRYLKRFLISINKTPETLQVK